MSQERKVTRPAPDAGNRPHPDQRTHRLPGRSTHERTTPAITREAPWFASNACSVPLSLEGPQFGPTRFVLGANVPWVHYGVDVGTSPWRPEGGLHGHPEDAALLRQVFERLHADGVQTARFFLLADGRSGVRFAEDGTPEGLDGSALTDIEVVLEAARSSGVGLILVLLDAAWLAAPGVVEGHPVRGHADTIRDAEKRNALLERVLRPILMRFGEHPAVLAWEILSSADVCVAGLGPPPAPRRGLPGMVRRWLRMRTESPEAAAQVTSEEMRAFLCDAVTLVRRHTRAYSTAGVTRWSSLGLVRGVGLDVYSVSWPADEAELRLAVSDLRLDRPLLLNSFPGNHPRKSIKTMLDTARCAGYGGALVWSVLRHDASSGYDGQVLQWARNHAGHLHRSDVPASPPAAVPSTEPQEEAAEAPASPPLVLQR